MHLSLFSLVPAFFLLFLPTPCSAKNLDSVRSFSYIVSGMMAPQSFHVWTTRDGKVMMQVNYKEKNIAGKPMAGCWNTYLFLPHTTTLLPGPIIGTNHFPMAYMHWMKDPIH